MSAPSNPFNPEAWMVAAFQVVVDKAWDGIAGWRTGRNDKQELGTAWNTALESALRDTWQQLSEGQKTALQQAAQAKALANMATITQAELMHSDTTAQTLSNQMVQFCKLEQQSEPPQALLSEALAVMLERFKLHLFAAHNDYRVLLTQVATVESAETLRGIENKLEGISGKLDPKPSSFPEAEYRASILREFQHPTFAGIVSQEEAHGAKMMTVINLFVDLQVSRVVLRGPIRDGDPGVEINPELNIKDVQAISEVRDVLELLGRYSAVVVRGGPGAGKSTLLRYLLSKSALNQAISKLEPTDVSRFRAPLPIMIPVREYVTSEHQNLLDFIAHRACKSGQLPHFITDLRNGLERALNDGRCLVCVDGLDEIATDDQGKNIHTAITQWRGLYRQNRFVVTTRIAGYPNVRLDPTQFELLDLQELDHERIQRFLKHWFEIHEANAQKQQEQSNNLWQALEGQPTLQSMARNPLLLTIIAAVYRKGMQLPSQRVRLYERCMELLLESWANHRGQKLTDAEQNRPFYQMLEPILREIAWTMQADANTHEERLTIQRDTMESTVARFLFEDKNTSAHDKDKVSKREAKAFRVFIEKRVGLLNDNGNETFSFVHPSFQEYLAAQRIYENRPVIPVWDEIQDRLYDPKWREVILLTMGIPKVGGKEALPTKLLEHIQERGEQDALEEFTHRHLDLQLAAIADQVAVNGNTKNQTIEAVFELIKTQTHVYEHESWFILLSRCRGMNIVTDGLYNLAQNIKFNETVRIFAARALGTLGEKSQAATILLKIASGDFDDTVRCNATDALGVLGEKSQVAINGLLKIICSSTSDSVRVSAIDTLAVLGETSLTVTNCLLNIAQNDSYDSARWHAANALGKLGKKTQAAKILFDIACSDLDVYMRLMCAISLGDLGGKSQSAPLLLDIARSNDENNTTAAEALGTLGDTSQTVINGLLAITRNDTLGFVRLSAAEALMTLGEKLPTVVNCLLNITQSDPDDRVRLRCAETLGALGEKSQAAIILLEIARSNTDEDIRTFTAEALGALGEKSQAVINGLLNIARSDPESNVREAAIFSLNTLGDKSQAVINGLLEIAQSNTDDSVRRTAAQVLGTLGEKSQATKILLEIFHSNTDDDMGMMVVHALKYFGDKSQAAIDGLLEIAYSNTDGYVRLNAAEALGTLGEKSQAATILLDLARNNTNESVRLNAAEALGTLGEKSQAATILLDLARNGTVDGVHSSAAEALRTLTLESPLIPKTS